MCLYIGMYRCIYTRYGCGCVQHSMWTSHLHLPNGDYTEGHGKCPGWPRGMVPHDKKSHVKKSSPYFLPKIVFFSSCKRDMLI